MKVKPRIYFYTAQQKIEVDHLGEGIEVLSTLKDVEVILMRFNGLLAVDTETEGMWDSKKRIVSVQISDGKKALVIDTRGCDEVFTILKPYLEKSTCIFHNVKFDYKFFKQEGIILDDVHDTFLAECVLFCGHEGHPLGLEAVVKKYASYSLDKSVRNQFVGLSGSPFTTRQIVYGAEDVLYLHKVIYSQLEELRKLDLIEVYNLERRAVLALADIEYNGMYIDTDKWLSVARQTGVDMKEASEILDSHVLTDSRLDKFKVKAPQLNLFSSSYKEVDINWSSHAQTLPVLQALGINVDSTNEKIINKYSKQEPLIKDLVKYKKSAKLHEAFGEDFLKYINPHTHRIHQDIWQILSTGRMSSRNPNLTQIPSKGSLAKQIRASFIAPKGYSIVGGDFSGCELRIIADGSQDPVWLEEFKGAGKVHDLVACMMFGIDMSQTKETPEFLNGASYRDVAKTIDFGLAYGMSHFKLSDTLQISEEEAKRLINIFFSSFPKIKGFLDMIGSFAKKNGYVRTFRPFRRIRWFPEWKKAVEEQDFKTLGAIERAGKNMPIQGTNADLTKLSLVKIRQYILDNKLPVKLINVIHDEILTECEESFADEWRIIMGNIMTEAGNSVIKSIPMTVDCKVTNCWEK